MLKYKILYFQFEKFSMRFAWDVGHGLKIQHVDGGREQLLCNP
jgi:hypothetical protein